MDDLQIYRLPEAEEHGVWNLILGLSLMGSGMLGLFLTAVKHTAGQGKVTAVRAAIFGGTFTAGFLFFRRFFSNQSDR